MHSKYSFYLAKSITLIRDQGIGTLEGLVWFRFKTIFYKDLSVLYFGLELLHEHYEMLRVCCRNALDEGTREVECGEHSVLHHKSI
jgi:hypothetical protein